MGTVWKIYYRDGSVCSSEDCAWEDADGWEAQVFIFEDKDVKFAMRHGADYFRLDDDGTVVGMDLIGLIDYVVNVLGIVKVGSMLSREKFDEIYQRAKQDMMSMKANK